MDILFAPLVVAVVSGLAVGILVAFIVTFLSRATRRELKVEALTFLSELGLRQGLDWLRHDLTAEDLVVRGTLRARRGSDEDARADFESALHKKSNLPEAINNIGVLDHDKAISMKGLSENAKKELLGQALTRFEEALEVKPDYAEALANRGDIYYHLARMEKRDEEKKKLEQARLDLLAALGTDPTLPLAHSRLGLVYWHLSQLDDQELLVSAENHLKRAIQLRPEYAAAYNNLGMVFALRGEYREAEKCYRRVIKLDPNDGAAYLNMACLYARQGQAGEACKWLEQNLQRTSRSLEDVFGDPCFDDIREDRHFKELHQQAQMQQETALP